MTQANASNLRRRLKRRIDDIAADRLPVADDFLAYLQERHLNAATRELLAIPGFLEDFKRAKREIALGKTTPLEQLRRKR